MGFRDFCFNFTRMSLLVSVFVIFGLWFSLRLLVGIQELLVMIRDWHHDKRAGKWTLVFDGLPPEPECRFDEDGAYDFDALAEYVVMISGSTKATSLYYSGCNEWVDVTENVYKVIAWMPMPEPFFPEKLQRNPPCRVDISQIDSGFYVAKKRKRGIT